MGRSRTSADMSCTTVSVTNLGSRISPYSSQLEKHGTPRRHQPHHRLDGSRSADSVAPQQADDFTLADTEADALENMTLNSRLFYAK